MIIACLVLGYLAGSVSSAILVCRVFGHPDPRTVGSHNPGATNVLREFGKYAAAATLIGDVAKGYLPVLLASSLGASTTAVAAAGLGAFLGHLYPVFFGFAGGKGVATLIGVLFGFSPWLGLAFIGIWLVIATVSRFSSLAALTATALAPACAYLLGLGGQIIASVALMGVFVFWRHRSNIAKLTTGREDKIGRSERLEPHSK